MARVLFVQNMDYEFLGPMYISAMAKSRGHQCRVAIGNVLSDITPVIDQFRPDIVAFSVMTGGHHWARWMAGEIKDAFSIPNVFGGPHATFFPEFARECSVDMLVRGEGEETMVDILDRIDAGASFEGVPNLCYLKNGQLAQHPLRALRSDPDEYPFPDRHLYDAYQGRLDRHVRAVISSRGCPYHCTFCFEDSMRELYRGKGKHVRIRSIENVVEECRQLREESNVRVIYFADDVFGVNKRWLYNFLPVYKRDVGLEFICLLRADIVSSDEQYALHLAKAGCRSAFFGIETGNEDIRNRVLRKNLTNEQIIAAADLLHRAGIKFRAYNIVGLPDETLADAISTVELNIRIRTDYPWCSVFSPYPGTALAEYATQRGYLDPHFDCNELSQSFFLDSRLDLPKIREMQNLQKFFQTGVLWPKTLPLIKRLIRMKPNALLNYWFGLVYFYVFVRSEHRGFWDTLRFAVRNFRHVTRKR
ncbi:MAG: B12-binding domain-containing radical SAM protein [Phycisphaerae bacterium]|nr:B12-binding domain-containing radical SAM protein [Phycisphaerae bacterium]